MSNSRMLKIRYCFVYRLFVSLYFFGLLFHFRASFGQVMFVRYFLIADAHGNFYTTLHVFDEFEIVTNAKVFHLPADTSSYLPPSPCQDLLLQGKFASNIFADIERLVTCTRLHAFGSALLSLAQAQLAIHSFIVLFAICSTICIRISSHIHSPPSSSGHSITFEMGVCGVGRGVANENKSSCEFIQLAKLASQSARAAQRGQLSEL